MIAVGLFFYSILLIVATALIARQVLKRKTTAPVVNVQAKAIEDQIQAHDKVLEEIDHAVNDYRLSDYFNSKHP